MLSQMISFCRLRKDTQKVRENQDTALSSEYWMVKQSRPGHSELPS